jgi:hypothetical protein
MCGDVTTYKNSSDFLYFIKWSVSYSMVGHHSCGLIGAESYLDMQKILIINFFVKIGYIGGL